MDWSLVSMNGNFVEISVENSCGDNLMSLTCTHKLKFKFNIIYLKKTVPCTWSQLESLSQKVHGSINKK